MSYPCSIPIFLAQVEKMSQDACIRLAGTHKKHTVTLQAVKCFGTNFELISKLFPGRCRRALANKWRREMKASPDKCSEALKGGDGSEGYQRIVEALQEGEVRFYLAPNLTLSPWCSDS